VGDIDNDGWLDMYVTTMSPLDDALLHNLGDGVFDDVTVEWGASSTAFQEGVAWGAIFIDVDSDGDEDLFVTHGYHSNLDDEEFPNNVEQADILFLNKDGAFEEGAAAAGVDGKGMSRSPVEADLNADGFPDLVVGTIGGAPAVYLNSCSNSVNWIGIRFKPQSSNRSAIGARVTVEAGGRIHMREIGSGNDGLYGAGPPEVTIGLGVAGAGEADNIEKLTVRWPDGKTREWTDLGVNRWVTLWE
jgi:hypothetical protein